MLYLIKTKQANYLELKFSFKYFWILLNIFYLIYANVIMSFRG